jgi:3-hydroxyacyl-CoA dehydrogenase
LACRSRGLDAYAAIRKSVASSAEVNAIMTAQIGVTAATGFLGLGQMGGPMAERLIDAGTRLKVFDPDDQATARLVAKGAQAVA